MLFVGVGDLLLDPKSGGGGFTGTFKSVLVPYLMNLQSKAQDSRSMTGVNKEVLSSQAPNAFLFYGFTSFFEHRDSCICSLRSTDAFSVPEYEIISPKYVVSMPHFFMV